MTALTREARQALKAHGITPKKWATIQGQPDGKWHGDACGCNDDRCVGYHHEDNEDCGCLPALIQWHYEHEAGKEGA